LIALQPSSAAAQPAPAAAPWPPPPPRFQIDVMLYGWLPSTHGSLSAERFSVDGNQWIWDADAVLGAMVFVEASYGRWRAMLNNIYGYQRFDLNRPVLGDITQRTQLYILEAAGGYDIVQNGFGPTFGPPERPRQRQVILTPYAGIRFLWIRNEIDVQGQSPASEATTVAGIFGLRGRVDVGERWWIGGGGDLGGGAELIFTWSAYGTVGYRVEVFGRPASIDLGYRAIGFQVREGRRDRATFDAILHGPHVGLTISLN
jgi:hypothetical protein